MTRADTVSVEVLERFQALFRGRENAHGQYFIDPKHPAKKKVTTVAGPASEDDWSRHLKGVGAGLGIVPIRQDNHCYFGAIDIDAHDGAPETDLSALAAVVAMLQLPLVVCRSKSGGAHLYLFLSDPAPTKLVRAKLKEFAATLNLEKNNDGRPVEIFAKQDRLKPGEKGNWINLPYQAADDTNRYAVDDGGDRLSLADFLSFAEARRISSLELEAFQVKGANPFRDGPPCLETLHDIGFPQGMRNQGMYNVGVFFKLAHPEDWQARTMAYNDERCDPPLRPAEMQQIIRSLEKRDYAYTCNQEPLAGHCNRAVCKKRKYGIAASADKASEKETDAIVQELNQKYGIIQVGDKVRVLQDNGDSFELLRKEDFRFLYQNQRVGRMTAGDAWLSNPMRRSLDGGIVFEPPGGKSTLNAFNVFRGWGVEPTAGECSLFLEHVRANVCQGDEALYRWVMGWFAWIVQHPTKKLGTALALRGKQGTGKSIIGDTFGRLLGRHWVKVDDPHYVTGRFNSHLEHCLLLQAEEAFWAGSKAAEGRLKNLVTSSEQLIERKGVDPYTMPNYVRLFVTSNEDWVVPAGFEERRFAVLDVSDSRMKDFAYFGAIIREMEGDGYGALMHHLQTMVLDESTLRTIPNTKALDEQKRRSEAPEFGWLREVLQDGVLPGDEHGTGVSLSEDMHFSYVEYAKERGVTRRLDKDDLGRFIAKVCPGAKRTRVSVGGKRPYARQFPPLAETRAQFDAFTGQSNDWDDSDEWLKITSRF